MLETENKILHILLQNQEQQNFLIENLESAFFEDAINSGIFKEAKKLYLKGEEIDVTIINENLKSASVSERMADIILCDFVPSVMAKKYAQKLFNNYLEKRIKASKSEKDFEEIKELKNSYLFREDKTLHISHNAQNFEQDYLKKKDSAIFTLYPDLDDCIGSFMGGDYIALGAATGMGKTSLALNIARRVCMQDRNVLYFSLEMPLEQLQNRFVCMNEELSARKYRNFGFNLVEMTKYIQGLNGLKDWSLYAVFDYNLTPEKMRMYIESQKKKGLDFVILDYLGLMSGYANKSNYERISLLSRNIKLLAGEFNVPILVLVQLNRDLKQRQDKRPVLSDIRESGAIEQDSDYVIFAHREGYYDRNKPQNELELIIAKNRHGETNKILKFDFDLSTQLIKELPCGYNPTV
jgi:replicative DNA helicase